jgi:hypothetical protein
MKTIDVDDETHSKVVFAARLMNCSPSEVIRRLVVSWSTAEESGGPQEGVAVHAIYRSQRVEGVFDPAARTLTVTSGPHAGTSYPSPSAAAMAVIQALNPDRSPNANGWTFWRVTRSGEELKSLRRSAGM